MTDKVSSTRSSGDCGSDSENHLRSQHKAVCLDVGLSAHLDSVPNGAVPRSLYGAAGASAMRGTRKSVAVQLALVRRDTVG